MGRERVNFERDRLKYVYDGISGNKTYEITNTKKLLKDNF